MVDPSLDRTRLCPLHCVLWGCDGETVSGKGSAKLESLDGRHSELSGEVEGIQTVDLESQRGESVLYGL